MGHGQRQGLLLRALRRAGTDDAVRGLMADTGPSRQRKNQQSRRQYSQSFHVSCLLVSFLTSLRAAARLRVPEHRRFGRSRLSAARQKTRIRPLCQVIDRAFGGHLLYGVENLG